MTALTGSIPPLSRIPGLTSFSAGLNQLSGALPSDWLSLMNVREFDVVGNRCAAVKLAVTLTRRLLYADFACPRLNGSLPDIGFVVPGLDPTQFPFLGLGGDLYSDLCKLLISSWTSRH